MTKDASEPDDVYEELYTMEDLSESSYVALLSNECLREKDYTETGEWSHLQKQVAPLYWACEDRCFGGGQSGCLQRFLHFDNSVFKCL